LERKSLDEWTTLFSRIYSNRNLGLRLDEILLRLTEEAGELVKPVLTNAVDGPKGIKDGLPDILAWVCAFADKAGLSLDKAMQRYLDKPPGIQSSIKVSAIIQKPRAETLPDWQKYLEFIYREQNNEHGPQYSMTKLVEDIGKASHMLRTGSSTEEVCGILASAVAWSIGLANQFGFSLAEATWRKYPASCVHCSACPCICSSLTRVFISYTSDTENYLEVTRKVISKFMLASLSFPDFGPSFDRIRMVHIFDAISRSDGGVILFNRKYSVNVYAELLEMLRTMDTDRDNVDNNSVWILVKEKTASDRDPQLVQLLEDLEHAHRIDWFNNETDLVDILEKNIKRRLEKIRSIPRR